MSRWGRADAAYKRALRRVGEAVRLSYGGVVRDTYAEILERDVLVESGEAEYRVNRITLGLAWSDASVLSEGDTITRADGTVLTLATDPEKLNPAAGRIHAKA